MKFIIESQTTTEAHIIEASDLADARHWVINHLLNPENWDIERWFTCTLIQANGELVTSYPCGRLRPLAVGERNYYGEKMNAEQVQRANVLISRIRDFCIAGMPINEAELNLLHEAYIIPTLIKEA